MTYKELTKEEAIAYARKRTRQTGKEYIIFKHPEDGDWRVLVKWWADIEGTEYERVIGG